MLLRFIREALVDNSVTYIATLTGNAPGGEAGTYDSYISGLLRYNPKGPKQNKTAAPATGRHGGDFTRLSWQNVEETAEIRIQSTTASNVLDTVGYLDQFATAVERRRNEGLGDRCWVEFRTQDSGTLVRSELLALEVSYNDRALERLVVSGGHGNHILFVSLKWARRWYWEDATVSAGAYALTEIPLSTGGAYSTGGSTIENSNSEADSYVNWVEIQPSDLSGSTYFRPLIRAENLEASAVNVMWLAHRSFDDTTDAQAFQHYLEAEDATDGSGTPTAEATASDNSIMELTWSDDTIINLIWPVTETTSAFLNACGGEFYKIMARFHDDGVTAHDPDSNFEINAQLVRNDTTDVLMETGWQHLADATIGNVDKWIQELGVLQIPPSERDGISDYGTIRLRLRIRNLPEAGSHELNPDYVMLFRAEGFRKLEATSTAAAGIDTNEYLYDDHVNNEAYKATPSKEDSITWRGARFLMDPARAHRVYFLCIPADIDHQHTIRMWYRPTYLFPPT